MAIQVGGNEISGIIYRGKPIQEVMYGGEVIWALQKMETLEYTSPGTYVVPIPDWATDVSYIIIGGGGGGSAGRGDLPIDRRGGSAGRHLIRLRHVTGLHDIYIKVGKGGAGGTGSSVNGKDGEESYLKGRSADGSVTLENSGKGGSGGAGDGNRTGGKTGNWTNLHIDFPGIASKGDSLDPPGTYGDGGDAGHSGIFGNYGNGKPGMGGYVKIVFHRGYK